MYLKLVFSIGFIVSLAAPRENACKLHYQVAALASELTPNIIGQLLGEKYVFRCDILLCIIPLVSLRLDTQKDLG